MITRNENPPIYGLSTDEKPANCANGQRLILMDTGETKYYDEEHGKWLPEEAGT